MIIVGDHNYCRNPDNRLPAPWCFTDADPLVEETCAVRPCNGITYLHSFVFKNKNLCHIKDRIVRLRQFEQDKIEEVVITTEVLRLPVSLQH